MAKEISVPGDRQIKALFTSAGNPVLSVPNGDELEGALEGLELMVGLDLYVNETTAHCDYVLPVTTMYERDDFAVTFQTFPRSAPFQRCVPSGEKTCRPVKPLYPTMTSSAPSPFKSAAQTS